MARVKIREIVSDERLDRNKEKGFFRDMLQRHLQTEEPLRKKTGDLILGMCDRDGIEARKRVIECGDDAVPQLYLISREWKNFSVTLKALKALKGMNTELSRQAVSFILPELNYTLYEWK